MKPQIDVIHGDITTMHVDVIVHLHHTSPMGGGGGEIGVWYTGVLGGIFMKISAMNETVCNHLFRDTPWRVSVRLTKTDRRGNLGVFANDFKLQLAERIRRFGTGKQRFYHLYIGGGVFLFQ